MNCAKNMWRPEWGEENRLPPIPKLRPRYVDNCRYCSGVHFNHAEYLACAMADHDQGRHERA